MALVNCTGYGEVELIERGHQHGLSKIRLVGGVETMVPTSYLPAEEIEEEEAKAPPAKSAEKKRR